MIKKTKRNIKCDKNEIQRHQKKMKQHDSILSQFQSQQKENEKYRLAQNGDQERRIFQKFQ
jgi:hypothetical protein